MQILSTTWKLWRMEKSTAAAAAHRISLGVPNTIFYWLPLYRGTQSSIFSLPLSLILQYLFGVFTFPFHFILGRVLRPSLGLCLHLYRHSAKLHRSSVSDSTSFHHFFSLQRSHSLCSNVCRSGCDSMSRGVPSRFQSGPLSLTSDAPINSADPFGGSWSRSLAPESCLH